MRIDLLWIVLLAADASLALPSTPEGRALAFLAREVPRWSPANNCYSCHNNGDGARALYGAVRLQAAVPAEALRDTSAWLNQPDRWDHNGGDGPYSDKKLARIQFGAALVAAIDAGALKGHEALRKAAELVAPFQEQDGSWHVEAEGTIGSPVTYGPVLATHLARETLRRADKQRYRGALTRSGKWLRGVAVRSVLDAAAACLALSEEDDPPAEEQRRRCLELIRAGQARDGGWGPFAASPPEAFDTAVVLLALAKQPKDKELTAMIRRGRAWLLGQQLQDGSWPETTRPPGARSYAQRLSTTAWAALALLATQER